MKSQLQFLLIFTLLPGFISCGPSKNDEIISEIQENRQTKNEYFQNNPNSPIPLDKREQFETLKYFPVDLDYRITTSIDEYAEKDTVVMHTTKKRSQYYLRWGKFDFTINGNRDTLHVYQPLQTSADQEPYFFIPFYDATNNNSTYGGGRYLDIPVQETTHYVIDFNDAYNPYCAYDYERWSCPMPPLENTIEFPIMAGEEVLYPQE